ncbi:hypothetical protein EDD15DRAFT_2518929 [Pisolithus albus]|nr:hypothetical protein EDD15DRAFT_2518929 [Pisolithus albus]
MEDTRRLSRAPLESHPEFSGEGRDLPAYFEEVVEYGKAQGRSGDLAWMNITIAGAPSLHKLLWCLVIANAPAIRQWDSFKALVTLQYPEIEPVEDILEAFEGFQSNLEETRCNELSSVEALGDYLCIFRIWFLGMPVRGNAVEASHQSQLFLRGLPPHVELEVSRRLESRFPLFRSGRLWPIEVVVRITKEVIEDGARGTLWHIQLASVVQARPGSKATAWARLLRAHGLGNVRPSREPGQALYGGSARPQAPA